MRITQQVLDQIVKLAQKHQVIAIGEIHGAKENPLVLQEIVTLLYSQQITPVIGFELPQVLIDNPEGESRNVIQDGRYSVFHKELILDLKAKGVKVFGFDINSSQWEQVNDKDLSWRDDLMAENLNKHLRVLKQNEKMIIICGDAHFQTLETIVGHTNSDGEKVIEKFSPMGSKISVNSLLALHLRYQSGQVFNHKIKEVQPITLTKVHMFRPADDLIEIDIKIAHPIINT